MGLEVPDVATIGAQGASSAPVTSIVWSSFTSSSKSALRNNIIGPLVYHLILYCCVLHAR